MTHFSVGFRGCMNNGQLSWLLLLIEETEIRKKQIREEGKILVFALLEPLVPLLAGTDLRTKQQKNPEPGFLNV